MLDTIANYNNNLSQQGDSNEVDVALEKMKREIYWDLNYDSVFAVKFYTDYDLVDTDNSLDEAVTHAAQRKLER